MKLKKLPDDLSVCKLPSMERVNLADDLFFIGKTDEEISLVCRTGSVPAGAAAREDG